MAFTIRKFFHHLTLLRIGKGTKGNQRSQPDAMSPLPVSHLLRHLFGSASPVGPGQNDKTITEYLRQALGRKGSRHVPVLIVLRLSSSTNINKMCFQVLFVSI